MSNDDQLEVAGHVWDSLSTGKKIGLGIIHNRVAAQLGPLSSIPASLLLVQLRPRLGVSTTELRPIDHMPDIDCPVCVASGMDDQHTTESETKAMFSAAKAPKHLWLVDRAAHVDLLGIDPIQYQHQIIGFLDRHLRDDRKDASAPSDETERRSRAF